MSRIASRIVRGTPLARVVDEPKLDRMSARTTPLWLSTSGPFVPSPGNGPAVSSGMAVLQSAAPVPDVAALPGDAPGVALEIAGPHPMSEKSPAPTAP